MQRITVILAMLIASLLVPLPASADPPEEVTVPAYFYEQDGYALFTGPPWEQGCLGEGFPEATGRSVGRDGNLVIFVGRIQSGMNLYDLDALGLETAFELLDVACSAVVAGEDPPAAVASGTGTVRFHERCRVGVDGCFSPGSVVVSQHRTTAVLTDMDGNDVDVLGLAKETLTFGEADVDQDVRYVRLRVR